MALVGTNMATLGATLITHNNDIIIVLFSQVFRIDTPFSDSSRTVMTTLEGEYKLLFIA